MAIQTKALQLLVLATLTLNTSVYAAAVEKQTTIETQVQTVPLDYNSHPPVRQVDSEVRVQTTSNAPAQNGYQNTYQTSRTQQTDTRVSAVEQTLSIIKPDAVATNHIGDIISRFEKAGLKIAAIRMTKLTTQQAKDFYAVHKDRPFYAQLVDFMSSGPIVAMVLEGQNAITKNRELMGVTDPNEAASGTLRADFAESKSRNAVHGSDSPQAAQEEISFFFKSNEIFKH